MRPLSINNPIDAIAMTAMVVAIVPVSAPSNQLDAAKIGFDGFASVPTI
jgi:hypothetical protein